MSKHAETKGAPCQGHGMVSLDPNTPFTPPSRCLKPATAQVETNWYMCEDCAPRFLNRLSIIEAGNYLRGLPLDY